MSREVKFRAWDEKNKQFADYEDVEECLSCQNSDGWKSSDGMGCCFGINAVEILADCIIEQYTGLKDKNGKEIYEGDIVEIDKYGKFQIIWNEWACKFDFDKIGKREREEPLLSQDWEEKSEVIGNIHENPELLGGGE